MPMCERPAGQSMDNPTSHSHVELGLGNPFAALEKIQHRYELVKDYGIICKYILRKVFCYTCTVMS